MPRICIPPPRRLAYLATAAFITLSFLIGWHFASRPSTTSSRLSPGSYYKLRHSKHDSCHFHLLLPTTGPNLDFCRLLLSAGILGYPEPIFIGWDGRGIYNGTESHLFKITETLAYLRSLPPTADEDMVLILDSYDIWTQLRPEVLISRYFDVLRKNDARIQKDGLIGTPTTGSGNPEIRHSIVFGPDKIFWPQGPGDPATWSVPESTLPKNSFGLATDTHMLNVRPRWLNSGTIMGPARAMREMFGATVDMLSRKYDSSWEWHGSDQFYFAEVWAEQELNRMKVKNGGRMDVPDGEVEVPEIPAGKRTEYGICLDYEMDLCQTAAAFEYHVHWMRFNGSNPRAPNTTERIDQWQLKEDVARSRGPFAASPKEFPRQEGWEEMMLGTSSVSKVPFPIFHVTGDKTVRDRWWPRLWFHPHGEALLKASKRKQAKSKDPATFTVANGVKWKQARPDGKTNPVGAGDDQKGGAWRDNGEYIPWSDMCSLFEDQLYQQEAKENL